MSEFTDSLLTLISSLIIGTLLLMLVARIFKLRNNFIPTLKVEAIMSGPVFIFSFFTLGTFLGTILVIGGIILHVFLIKKFFKIKVGKAIGMWAVLLGFTILLTIIIVAIMWSYLANFIESTNSVIALS